MTQFNAGANVHLQFCFSADDRFLIWDNSKDGKFGFGYEESTKHVDETKSGGVIYDATDGLVLDWAVIVQGTKAYFYLNGQLVKTFDGFKYEFFNIGATNANVTLYDIEIDVKSKDSAGYADHVAPYFNEKFITINNLGGLQSTSIVSSGKTYSDLNDNYIIRGTLDITDMYLNNAHLQFRFASGRFLLWDNNNDGKYGAGYQFNGDKHDGHTGVTLYDANNGITLDWAVVVDNGKAYWYINGKLEQTIVPVKLESFNIGALNMDVKVYDIEIFESGDADYTTELAKYSEANNA